MQRGEADQIERRLLVENAAGSAELHLDVDDALDALRFNARVRA
jgi:hypothetical protein